MPRCLHALVLTLLGVWTVDALAAAGVAVTVEVQETGAEAIPQRVLLLGKDIKLSGAGGEAKDMVFKGSTDEMLAIDHERGEYMLIDRATVEQLAGGVAAISQQMDAVLRNLPPEQREMMEKMMKGKLPQATPAPTAPEIRATGETATHGGLKTRRFDVFVDGRKRSEFWVANWNDIDPRVRTAFEHMASFMKGLVDKLPAKMSDSVRTGGFEAIGDLNGLPMLTREFDASGKVAGESRVTGITDADVDVAIFNPPAGYTRRSLPF
ncbi:MAG: hypothetical protein R3E84_18485 [Pseudomonadales bacterium]